MAEINETEFKALLEAVGAVIIIMMASTTASATTCNYFRLGRMSGRINPNPLFCCPPNGQSAKK